MEYYLDEFSEDYFEEGGELYDPSLDMLGLDIDKLFCALEYVEDSYDMSIREADLKCYTESADDDTLMEYYEDANTKMIEKSQNIIQKIWKKLLELFEKIKTKFRKKVDVPPETKVYVPKPFHNLMKKFNSAWSSAKSVIIAGKDGLAQHKAVVALITLLTAALASVGGIVISKYNKKHEDEKIQRKLYQLSGESLKKAKNAKETMDEELRRYRQFSHDAASMQEATGKDLIQLGQEMQKAHESIGTIIKKHMSDAKAGKSDATDGQKASVLQTILNCLGKGVDKITSLGIKANADAKKAAKTQ